MRLPQLKVPGRGVEPRSLGLQPSALPLSEPGEWFPRVDSNHDAEIQSLASYHWTTGNGSRARIQTWSLLVQSQAFYQLNYP